MPRSTGMRAMIRATLVLAGVLPRRTDRNGRRQEFRRGVHGQPDAVDERIGRENHRGRSVSVLHSLAPPASPPSGGQGFDDRRGHGRTRRRNASETPAKVSLPAGVFTTAAEFPGTPAGSVTVPGIVARNVLAAFAFFDPRLNV